MKKKLVWYFGCMTTAAILLTTILMAGLTHTLFERYTLSDMQAKARLAVYATEQAGGACAASLLGDEMRLTMIDAQGTVLYDSASTAALMENHADRSEVADALESGNGMAVRRSATLEKDTYYYAVRLADGGVLRLAEEASSIWDIYFHAAPATLLIIVLVTGLCAIAANAMIKRLISPIAEMTEFLDDEKPITTYPELEPFIHMIRQQHQEILRSADMRVQFTANVSHELKTPLTSISGYAELIESGMAKGEQAQSFAGEIRKSANRLLTLINDIIRLSQMDSPSTTLNLEPVDMEQIAADVMNQLQMNAQKMNVSLQLDARSAVIQADKRMMEELLYNLCDNAIRYNVPGGSVHVEVRPLREQLIVCVQDTGIGISQENQERVFERFYRVDKSRSKATGGTGLGLAIVKHIAAQHGAAIQMDSELGRGTAITVTFER